MSDDKSVILRAYPGYARPWIAPGHTGTNGATQLRMTVKDDRVILAAHSLLLGKSAGGKDWSRWKTSDIITFKVNELKSGERRLNIYRRAYYKSGGRTLSYVRNVSSANMLIQSITGGNLGIAGAWSDGYSMSTVHDTIIDLLQRNNLYVYDGEDTENDIYRSLFPAVNLWHPNDKLAQVNASRLTEGLRQPTIEDFISAQFGKTRYRKDLVKSLLNTSLRRIDAVSLFTGLVPVDWQINALRDETKITEPGRSPDINREADRAFRRVFREMTDARKRSLMDSVLTENNYYLIGDTFRQLLNMRDTHQPATDAMRQSRTVQELHDSMAVRPFRAVDQFIARANGPVQIAVHADPMENKVIETNEYIDAINALELEGHKFVCAVDTDMMRSWSDAMSNCIRSYANNAIKHRGIYIGVYREDKLFANIELGVESEGVFKLKQILGRFNATLPDEDRNKIVDALRTAVFIEEKKISQAWGGGGYVAAPGVNRVINPGTITTTTQTWTTMTAATTTAAQNFAQYNMVLVDTRHLA